jgi:hypothetical protein
MLQNGQFTLPKKHSFFNPRELFVFFMKNRKEHTTNIYPRIFALFFQVELNSAPPNSHRT